MQPEIVDAMRKCRSLSMPFATVLLPDSDEPLFFASDGEIELRYGFDPDWNGFIVSTFGLCDNRKTFGISQDYTIGDILAMPSAPQPTYDTDTRCTVSTNFDDYNRLIRSVVESLEGNEESKVVISRVLVEDSAALPFDVAESYFSSFTTCFRAIYYTPSLGMWIVATPEILLDSDRQSGRVSTMSLAGTRPVGSTSWDTKNLREHRIVTDYIVEVMSTMGLSPTVAPLTELRFGRVEHLCNVITAENCADPAALANRLSPTPAVCGYPREKALSQILEGEKHLRECYSGFVGINSDGACKLFVNLRCCKSMHLAKNSYRYILYAGGGINWLSKADDEWRETEMKIGPLKDLITK